MSTSLTGTEKSQSDCGNFACSNLARVHTRLLKERGVVADSHDNLLSFIYSLTHPLSHLALLAVLALMLNQIYSAVSTDSVFMVFSVALLLFFIWNCQSLVLFFYCKVFFLNYYSLSEFLTTCYD